MKFNRILFVLVPLFLVIPRQEIKAGPDSLTLGPAYMNDVFYSMENGTAVAMMRDVWDLAFSTKVFSASILINDGSGAALYTWANGDTSGWNAVDTLGMGTWPVMHNDPDDWENGAFSRHAKGHPDYGWGVYNMITHNVVGDSLYLLKRPDGVTYKIWIKVKTFLGAAPVWVFKYALLDGSNEQEITLNCANFTGKNFIYFSLTAGLHIDREPAATDWDLLFTKYMAIHPTGTPYIVTGVLSNYNTGANKFTGVPRSFNDWKQQPFDFGRAVIGYDWKTFDMGSFTFIVDDSTVFFVQSQAGDVYKLYFTSFGGSMTGNVTLYKEKISATGIPVVGDRSLQARLYPNPAKHQTILHLNLPVGDKADIVLYDLQGRSIRGQRLLGEGENTSWSIPLDGLTAGIYIVQLRHGSETHSLKLVVNRN